MEGCIFNIQRFSLHDGPGIRTIVFLKGCPLRCVWCHNPEGLRADRQLKYAPEKCIGCGRCVDVCHNNCHQLMDGVHRLDPTHCDTCMRCASICPSNALEANGQQQSVEWVIDQVLRDKRFFDTSGGGLTLSGGEPFYQSDFALEILRGAKEKGIHTAVETCGMAPSAVFKQAVSCVDLFLFDYKTTGDEQHRRVTGASQETILANLQLIANQGANIILRCPIIPTINDTDLHCRGIAQTADKYGVREINLMPYHSLGVSKRRQLGMETAFSADSMSSQAAAQIKAQVEAYTHIPVKVL